MKKKEIGFTIKGDDYQKLIIFQNEHRGCIEKLPNISCAQFEYSFTPDGFGLFKSVRCVCGDILTLTDDYSFVDEASESTFKIVRNRNLDEVEKLLLHFETIQNHPGLYFGKQLTWDTLTTYIAGMRALLWVEGRGIFSEQTDTIAVVTGIISDTAFEIVTDLKFNRFSEEDACEEFFRRLRKNLSEEGFGEVRR